MTQAVVGLSGGVDSAVAALLLKQNGFDVHGVYLKCFWTFEGCQSDIDRNSAARVASFLEIPFEVWDFEKEYRKTVVEYFYEEHKKGLTPNPDVVCNREIKFGLFLNKALKTPNIRFIATGHYARIGILKQESGIKNKEGGETIILPKFSHFDEAPDNGALRYVDVGEFLNSYSGISGPAGRDPASREKLLLFGGVDEKKDQSYFLYDIPKSAYEHILYPLGNLKKETVRKIARQENLPSANRPDSTGICFIGEVNVEKFLKERISEHTGNVLDKRGKIIGKHKGVEFYTIGQRHGFKINQNRSPAPYYVIGKNLENNQLIVGQGEECKNDCFLIKIYSDFQIPIRRPADKFQIFVRIRHLGELIPCRIEKLPSDRWQVKLDFPVFGIAPGQSAVFYQKITDKDYLVIGGGVVV